MPSITKPEWINIDGAEVSTWLLSKGFVRISTQKTQQGLEISVDDAVTEGAINDALVGFVPTSDGQRFIPPLPSFIHVQHLKDYLMASSPTNAETIHVIKDIIRFLGYVEKRLE